MLLRFLFEGRLAKDQRQAHIDAQPHEPSLKGVLTMLADELEKPL